MEKSMINGSRILLESLNRLGVTDMFGYPGGCVIPIYDEIYKYDTRIRIAYIYSSIFINLCYRYDSIIQNNS